MQLETTLMIVAPHEVQAIAVPLLRQYAADTLVRVPAHITVLYPFVPYERLAEACQLLRAICAETEPFEVTMQGYDWFQWQVAFMNPVTPAPVQALFRRIYARFPECPPYGGEFGHDLHPHMTVAEFVTEAEARAAVLPDYAPVSFRAERLHVCYGSNDVALPWITYDVIPLGSAG